MPRPRRRILEGVRILDFTWVVAGPMAMRLLCDQGAEVIKIERRDALDYGSRRGGLSGNLNRGKQSLIVDMNQRRGVELVESLVRVSDVVADNFSARVMDNWGLDYASLCRLRADIIALSMSGFGRSGPHRDYVSYGPTLQARAGYTLSMRHAGGAPAGWGFSYSDTAAGGSAALAVVIALWHRRRTGAGQLIDVSQLENLTALAGPALMRVLAGGDCPATGNRSPEGGAAPDGVFRCRDDESHARRERWCAITVFGDAEWRRFIAAIGAPSWTSEPRFADPTSRLRHAEELGAAVERWTRRRSAEEVAEALQGAGIAAAVVADAEDLCRHDPQLRARGYWVTVPTPEGDSVTLDGIPFQLSDRPGFVDAPGPLLGEHTDAVLRRVLRLPAEEIAELHRHGIVA